MANVNMSGGLVQNYSRSPIRKDVEDENQFTDQTPTKTQPPAPAAITAPAPSIDYSNPPRPMGQQHDQQILPVPTPDQYGGYRQSLVHDGGRTEYTEENKSATDYAAEALSSTATALQGLSSTAQERVTDAYSNVKQWWNPESKGMR